MSIIAQLGEDRNLVSSYGVNSNYNVPMYEMVDPATKETPEYCLKIVQAGFSQLMRNRNIYPTSSYSYIQTLRNYGSGNQDEQYYLNLYKDEIKNTQQSSASYDTDGVWTQNPQAKRQGLDHINPKIISPVNNLKLALQGIFSQYDENLYVNCIDSESAKEEDMRMFGAMFDSQMSEFTQVFEEQFGIPLNPNPKLPKGVTLDEMQIYKELGGFKSIYAIAIEEILKYTEKLSNWPDVIKRKWIDDLFDINFIVGRCKYDPEKDVEVWEYVDPENFTIQYSQENDFKDAEYCGYFTLEKISKLDVLGFDRDKLLKAARRWQDLWGNPKNVKWDSVTYDDRIGNFKVPVFHYNWIDVDVIKHLKVENEYRTTMYEIPFDKKVKPLSDYRKKQNVKQEEVNTRVRRAYECSWVVDTDMIYQYGRIKNAPRKSKKTPMLNFFAWRGNTTNKELLYGSVIESIIPFLDQIQMAWLKYQDSLAKAHPGGYAINIRLLQNLQIDGKDVSPLQCFEMFWKTGKFPYLDVPIGERYSGGAVLPITKIEGNLGELLAVISNEIHLGLQMIERFTGINPAPLGQTPDKDAPVSTTNMAVIGTNNVLRPYINGMYHMKECLGDCTARRAQLQIRNNEKARKAYSMIIGEFKVDQLREAEKLGVDYGLFPETRPNEAEINSLLQTAQVALSPGRDGNPQIDLSQYTYIMEQVRGGANIKKLSRDLAFMIRKNKEEIEKRQRENIQLQVQQQQQLEQQKAQNQAALSAQETEKDMMMKQADTQGQMLIDNNKAKNDVQIKQIEANDEFKKMLYLQRERALQSQKEQQMKQSELNQDYQKMLYSQREKLIGNGKR